MKKKHAPEQYAAKSKIVDGNSSTTLSVHPAVGVAKKLVSWMERGGVPPSIVLLHGLYLARCSENNGLPVDTYLPHLKMQSSDSKTISDILDALARPQAIKTRVIAAWLQSFWVNKTPDDTRISSAPKRKIPFHSHNPAMSPKEAHAPSLMKPAIIVKRKRDIGMWRPTEEI